MKPEQLMQTMAAPLASLFLILSLCAFRMNLSHATGERLFPTRSFHASGFNDCLDDHRLLFHLHANNTVSINRSNWPLAELSGISQRILQYRVNPDVWFFADPTVPVEDVGKALDALHSGSPAVEIFLLTKQEMSQYLIPKSSFDYIGVTHPERFPHNPSICILKSSEFNEIISKP
jgi:hypothetical protein